MTVLTLSGPTVQTAQLENKLEDQPPDLTHLKTSLNPLKLPESP